MCPDFHVRPASFGRRDNVQPLRDVRTNVTAALCPPKKTCLKQRFKQALAGLVIETPEPLRLRLCQGQPWHLQIFAADPIKRSVAGRAATECWAI
jgi:hypothetical protein